MGTIAASVAGRNQEDPLLWDHHMLYTILVSYLDLYPVFIMYQSSLAGFIKAALPLQ
jgi:hypothetical protein